MAITSFTIQKIPRATFKKKVTLAILGSARRLKECGIENGQETVYAMGGEGNAKLTAESHSKATTGTMVSATYDTKLLALVTGTDSVVGAASYPINGEILTVTSDAAVTSETAIGTATEEILGLFIIENGQEGTEYTQGAAVGSETFTYTPGTKTLDFNTSELADGTQISVYYEYTSSAETTTITNNVNTFSEIVHLELDCFVRDECTKQEYAAVIIVPSAKLTGQFSTALAADGDPAVLDVSWEALKDNCINDRLWTMLIDGVVVA